MSLLRRIDVRLALALGAAMSAFMLALMTVLYVVSAREALSGIHQRLDFELSEAEGAFADPRRIEPPVPASSGIAVRRVGPDGAATLLLGTWPDQGSRHLAKSLSLRLGLADAGSYLMEERRLPTGELLQATYDLAGFVAVRRQQAGEMLASMAIGLLGVTAFSVYATRRALEPLRRATRSMELVDDRHLDARLPVRGTGDDLDRHAQALNRVFARLEESFHRIQAFSADVAHELRTPVNRMVNLLDAALLEVDAGRSAIGLEQLRDSAEQLQRLIEGLLLLARGDEGKLSRPAQTIRIADTLRSVVELYQPSCEEQGIALSLAVALDYSAVVAEPELLQRAISNLLDNAIGHTPRGGAICVDLGARGPWVEIAVSDSGPGIPEDQQDRIFDRFVQLDPARRRSGAGLGLAIVRMIARLHGGEVSASRSALGGARLELLLPAAGSRAGRDSDHASTRRTSSASVRARVA